jgi:enhancing lycopene biosynthesis protein 2
MEMKPIPIFAAARIANDYGYDQVVIMARKVSGLPIKLPIGDPIESGEYITTYGVNQVHCDVAALMGNTLKRIAQWPSRDDMENLNQLYDDLSSGVFDYDDHREEQIESLRKLLGK